MCRPHPNELEAELGALLIRLDFSDGAFPTEPWGSYLNFSAGEHKFRLYALTWDEGASTQGNAKNIDAESQLYLILQPVAGGYLPMGTELHVRETHLLSSGQQLSWTSRPIYLYTQIFGGWETQFSVEVHLPSAQTIQLPSLRVEKAVCDRPQPNMSSALHHYPVLPKPAALAQSCLL